MASLRGGDLIVRACRVSVAAVLLAGACTALSPTVALASGLDDHAVVESEEVAAAPETVAPPDGEEGTVVTAPARDVPQGEVASPPADAPAERLVQTPVPGQPRAEEYELDIVFSARIEREGESVDYAATEFAATPFLVQMSLDGGLTWSDPQRMLAHPWESHEVSVVLTSPAAAEELLVKVIGPQVQGLRAVRASSTNSWGVLVDPTDDPLVMHVTLGEHPEDTYTGGTMLLGVTLVAQDTAGQPAPTEPDPATPATVVSAGDPGSAGQSTQPTLAATGSNGAGLGLGAAVAMIAVGAVSIWWSKHHPVLARR
jgi:hypothetical protein